MKRKAGILVAVYAAVLAINLDTTIVNVALPSIARELGSGTRDLQWVVDGYNLAFAAYRIRMRSVAYRMLGSLNEADNAVQESWLHTSRSDTTGRNHAHGPSSTGYEHTPQRGPRGLRRSEHRRRPGHH